MASRRDRLRGKLCRNYALGHCPQGNQCKYVHPNSPPATSAFPPPQYQWPQGYPTPLSTTMRFPVSGPWVTWNPQHQQMQGRPWEGTGGHSMVQPERPASISQYKPLSWRTALCRHYTKNRGWCPLGDECNYIHDLKLADLALEDARFSGGKRDAATSDQQGSAGSKQSHCWAYVQGLCHVKDCPYLHPIAVDLFIRHTPCLAWPNCTKGALCPYKHPEPIIPKVHALPMSPQSTTSVHPPTPAKPILSGAVQYHGTTYFPLQSQTSQSSQATSAGPISPQDPRAPYHMFPINGQVLGSPPSGWPYPSPISPIAIHAAPSYPVPINPAYPYGSPPWHERMVLGSPMGQVAPGFPGCEPYPSYSGANYEYHHLPASSFPADDHVMYQADPSLPRGALFPGQPQESVPERYNIPRSSVDYHPVLEHAPSHTVPAAHEELQFPYAPRETQGGGPATRRRISVALRSKEDTDALDVSTHGERRASWQTHGTHCHHKARSLSPSFERRAH
ncbi:uncharacterized protein LAESUDRAFT_759614 [Laetiporus sulphureus 93-53]|uniref:C3H1-type domain-containing protein n=1 Tax=Laetiporus sulphureus 93-53 TaxID=1314785 RepID=A0A165E1T9_9APHY|nr:uncharacterized protein LAESUDRAFT_759614 [Laetiporus sulphureus 93-53]KZT06081.1 hypothetical protein LAESUDRAFT_759614 [Laetiporus sulphureus 93-53]